MAANVDACHHFPFVSRLWQQRDLEFDQTRVCEGGIPAVSDCMTVGVEAEG